MFGLDMLDVAVGVVVIYLFLSLAASAIQEIVENLLKKRAKDLEKGIRELLQGDQSLVERFYKHPLVAALYPGPYVTGGKDLPSYIPAKTFALAFLDIVEKPATAAQNIDAAAASAPAKLKTIVDQFTNAAVEAVDKRRQQVEDWFNGSMDRVSGWYKRRTHQVLILIGVAMAVLLNVDSIFVVQHLTTDRKTRDALVNLATETATHEEILKKDSPADLRVKQYLADLDKTGLPMGWKRVFPLEERPSWRGAWEWFLRILGWALTALAISLGAPFWFDTLNKIMVIRSTVKPREKSRDEASEDRQVKPQPAK